jgi:hypothetical protein
MARNVSYRAQFWASVLLALWSITAALRAQPAPRFTYSFEPCADIENDPGAPFFATVNCVLNTQQDAVPPAPGAQGWSMSLSCEGADITAITTQGTAGDLVPVGFRRSSGFERSEITMGGVGGCAGRGAASAVVLDFANMGVTLPSEGFQTLARITVEGFHPFTGSAPVRLFYVDGCTPSAGQPVVNRVTWQGMTVHPEVTECQFRLLTPPPPPSLPPPACPQRFTARANQFTKEVFLTWDPPSATAPQLFRYHIFRESEFIASVPHFTRSFVDVPPLAYSRHTVFNYELVGVYVEDLPGPCFPPDPDDRVLRPDCMGPCAPLVSTVVLSPGVVVFSQDFDDFPSDSQLFGDPVGGNPTVFHRFPDQPQPGIDDARWTVENPAGRANPPTLNGRPTVGRFLISDPSSAAGVNPASMPVSYDVVSSIIDTSALSGRRIWLHFDMLLQFPLYTGSAVFDVEVCPSISADGRPLCEDRDPCPPGSPDCWVSLLRRVAPARRDLPPGPVSVPFARSGCFGRVHLEITQAVHLGAAASQAVFVRLRLREPTEDFYVMVDNILVDDVSPPQATLADGGGGGDGGGAATSPTIIAEQQFCSGLPAGWTTDLAQPNAQDTWSNTDPCSRRTTMTMNTVSSTCTPNKFYMMDSLCTRYDGIGDPAEDEMVFTVGFDRTPYAEVYVVFDDEIAWYNVLQEVRAVSDAEDAANWILRYGEDAGSVGATNGQAPYFASRGFLVTSWPTDAVAKLRFWFNSTPPNQGWWAMDNVTLYGSPSTIRFKRGDANDDGSVNLTDGSYINLYLFQGGAVPRCKAAADADANGAIEITDSIYIFNYLFSGGAAPPRPGPLICESLHTVGNVQHIENGYKLGCATHLACP